VFRYARCFAIAAGNAALLAGTIAARADGVPGLRGHDHTGITVPDIRQAADFFINVLGCKEAMSFGPFADEKGNFMADLLNVDPRAPRSPWCAAATAPTSSCFNTVRPTRRP
jgi:hypothetical protein